MKPKYQYEKCARMNYLFELQRKGKLSLDLFKKAARALVNVGRVADARYLAWLRPKYSYRRVQYVDELISTSFAERKLVTCEGLECPKELFDKCLSSDGRECPSLGKCHPEKKLRYSPSEKKKMGIVRKQDTETGEWEFCAKAFNPSLFIEEVLKHFQIAYDTQEDVFFLFQDGCWNKQEKSASSTMRVQLMNFFDRLVPSYEWTPSIEQKYLARLANRCKRVSELLPPPENLINVKNGLIDWSGEEIELLPHDPAYFFRYHTGIKYDAKAKCPVFDKFLADITKNDESMMQLLLEWLGYVLTVSVSAEKALFLYGTAANGKTTYLRIMRKLAGGDSGASDVPLKDILSYRFGLFNVISKTVNIDSDTSAITDANFAVFKQIVSGEDVTGEGKGKNQFSVRLAAKLVFACNELPEVRCSDIEALRRRVCLVPFEQTFSSQPVGDELPLDNTLVATLETELPGILNKALQKLRRLDQNDYEFTTCKRSKKALNAFLRDSNPVNSYVKERLVVAQGTEKPINNTVLLENFRNWAKSEGYDEISKMSAQKFRPLLRAALRFNKYPFTEPRGENHTRSTGGIAFKKLEETDEITEAIEAAERENDTKLDEKIKKTTKRAK